MGQHDRIVRDFQGRAVLKTIVTGQNERVGRWVCERTGGTYSGADSVAIGLEEGGELIAGVLYDHYNGKSMAMHVAGVGSKWMTRQFLWYAFNYAFNECGVAKVLGLVSSANERAVMFDTHLGFIQEARISDACKDGDLLILTMTKDSCKWLSIGERRGR